MRKFKIHKKDEPEIEFESFFKAKISNETKSGLAVAALLVILIVPNGCEIVFSANENHTILKIYYVFLNINSVKYR